MRINFRNQTSYARKFQEGGAMPAGAPEEQMPAEGGAPAEQGAPAGGGAEEQMAQMAQQLVEMLMQQIGDPQAVAAVLQMALEMVAQAGAPAEGGQPVYRRGGQLIRRVRK